MPLKILHILDHSLPFHSGYALRTQNIFQAQRKRGWQPVGLTASEHTKIMRGGGKPEEIVGGFPYYRTAAGAPERFSLYPAGRLIATLTRRLREVVEIEKPHLLHVHSPAFNALSALEVGHQLAIPIVYEIRAFWEDAVVDHGTYQHDSWEYKLSQSLETWICKQADHVVVLCQGLNGALLKRGIPPAKLTIVPNGVDVDNLTPCTPDAEYVKAWNLHGKKVIGFIGSFFRYEGLDLLVEAMARLTTRRSNIVLLLVGAGRMEAALKAQIERLHLTQSVVLPGRIPHERISGVYALMDVLAYPRYSIRLTELVTPLKPLEAMAMAKALVASDIGGHRELIEPGHTGWLFPAGDAGALAEVLTHLLDNPDLRRQLARQGSTWVRQTHSWDMTTAVYSDIYARVLGN